MAKAVIACCAPMPSWLPWAASPNRCSGRSASICCCIRARAIRATYQVTNPDAAPTVSLTDDGYKLVVSRLGDRLRVAGTCELNGYTRELNTTRCEAITRRTRELFPDAAITATRCTGLACVR